MPELVVNGDRIIRRLDSVVRSVELLGRMEKVALQAFRDNPQTDHITVTLEGKEATYRREDFQEFPDTAKLLS